MTAPDELALLRDLADRRQILDCLHRYTRGVDRLDRELVLSAYHEDAIDDHGAFVGTAEDFVDWALPYHAENQQATNHLLLNHTCDLDGDNAHTETYCLYVGVNVDGTIDVIGNRYVDRLERREGRWAIARRVCVAEWVSSLPGAAEIDPLLRQAVEFLKANATTARDRTDVSYQRPLEITRATTTADKHGWEQGDGRP